ncbi:hypothetical protein DFR30_0668 [Thiogranum longum]|uniref:Uncharacterized protein n=1 Tax=Thiogranum longum TaxID=1537524 RepID=A0A4R1H884_9GAMM|nr:hypothetical protein [Thiogranum longum]TCK17438.1 hypothetical protein DFR30_0668 [Thiogranum longum]
MHVPDKIEHLIESHRDEKEVGLWLFSLIPLGVAFIFFFIFLLPMDLPNKDIILVTGAGAGAAGLQGYWIQRGWRREEGLTILLGLIGLIAVSVFVWAYINFLGEIVRSIFKGWAA